MSRARATAIVLAFLPLLLGGCAQSDAPGNYPPYSYSAPVPYDPQGICGALGNCPNSTAPYPLEGNPSSF